MRLPGLSEVGFKVLSQTDEDGILLYIFSIIGSTNRRRLRSVLETELSATHQTSSFTTDGRVCWWTEMRS